MLIIKYWGSKLWLDTFDENLIGILKWRIVTVWKLQMIDHHFLRMGWIMQNQYSDALINDRFFCLSQGTRALRTQQAQLTNSTMAHTTLMQQESCTTWSAWSHSQLCIFSCRAAGGNAERHIILSGFLIIWCDTLVRAVLQVWLCGQAVPLGGSSLAGTHGESSWC